MDAGEREGEDFDSQVTQCTNLVISNKISAKNAWELKLIDMMGENLEPQDMEDDEPVRVQGNRFRTEQAKNLPNFQKFAHILDAASNIYATRVDDAFVRTTRFQFGLQDSSGGSTAEGSSKEKRAVTAKTNATMLEVNPANITKVIEKGAQIDPLYDRAVATIDMAGAKGSLLDVLMLSEGLKVMFDSQEIIIGTNLRQGAFSDEQSQQRFEALKEDRKCRFKELDEYSLDNSLYQSLRGLIRPKSVEDLQICSGYDQVIARRQYYEEHADDVLRDFEIDIDTREMDKANKQQTELEHAIQQESMLGGKNALKSRSASLAGTSSDELSSLLSDVIDQIDDNEMVDHEVTSTQQKPQQAEHKNMNDDDDDDEFGMYDDVNDDIDDERHVFQIPSIAEGLAMDHEVIKSSMNKKKLSAYYEDEGLDQGLNHFTLDQLLSKSKFWAGEAVPKLRRVKNVESDTSSESLGAAKGKRKNKSEITLDFEAAYNAMMVKDEKKKNNSSTATMLKKREIEQQKMDMEKLLLPEDSRFTIDILQRPAISGHLSIPLKPTLKLAIQSATTCTNATQSNAFIDLRKVMGMTAAVVQPQDTDAHENENQVMYEDAYDDDNDDDNDHSTPLMDFDDQPLELIASERISTTAPSMEYTQKQTVFNIKKVKAEIVRSLVEHAEESVVQCNRANRVVYSAAEADKWDSKLGEETVDHVHTKQSLLGGNEGKMLCTDFSTLVNSLYNAEIVTEPEDLPSYQRGSNPIPGCFIALLLSANEKNLELRPRQPSGGRVQGHNHPDVDAALDLGNFDIFIPLQ